MLPIPLGKHLCKVPLGLLGGQLGLLWRAKFHSAFEVWTPETMLPGEFGSSTIEFVDTIWSEELFEMVVGVDDLREQGSLKIPFDPELNEELLLRARLFEVPLR